MRALIAAPPSLRGGSVRQFAPAAGARFFLVPCIGPPMSSLIISVSGLRGIVGESLTPPVAMGYVAAFARSLSDEHRGPIIVGRDGRTTGSMLKSAVMAALSGCGVDVIDADVAATPTIGVLVKHLGAAGAVQITASHNPPPYNGIKLFGPDGRVIGATAGSAVRDEYQTGSPAWVTHEHIGTIVSEADPHAPHLDAVLQTVEPIAIRAAAPKVLLDSNHGSGGLLGMRLLQSLGCNVVCLGGEPTGRFAHPPEPTAENLQAVGAEIVAHGCDVGFCQDPDADRLAIIDESGRYVGEEYTLALCVQRILSNPSLRGPVVINGATSGMTERLAADARVGCHRSSVGEANVADKMIDVGAVYGGEGNGGPIDPRVGYVRDSFVAMAQVLDWMARCGKPISKLCDALPTLHIHKDKASASATQLPSLFEQLIAAHPEADVQTGDGLRLAWPDRWLLVRGSNTEPIVRFIAEAESQSEAEALCQRAADLLKP